MPVSIIGMSKPEQHGRTDWPDQLPAEQHAQDDRGDRQALDPAVGLDQLRRPAAARSGCRTWPASRPPPQAHDGVGHQRVRLPNSIIRQPTTLMALETNITRPWGCVGKGADEGRQHHVEQREHRHQRACCHSAPPLAQQLDGRDEQALSASELKNCADMMVLKPLFIGRVRAPRCRAGAPGACGPPDRCRGSRVIPRAGRRYSTFAAYRGPGDNVASRMPPCRVRSTAPSTPPPWRTTWPRARARPMRVWAVVKANAYGHGIERVYAWPARRRRLRAARPWPRPSACAPGLARPVLLLEGVFEPRDLELFAPEPVARRCTATNADRLAAARTRPHQPHRVFLKMNSGMNRLGFRRRPSRAAVAA